MAGSSTGKWLRRWLRLIIFLGLVWSSGFIWFSLALQADNTGAVAKADAIAVLTGGRDRMMVGVDLLQQGKGQRLLISGVNPNIGDDHLRRVLGLDKLAGPKQGTKLFACCIDVGRVAPDTVGNAMEIGTWAQLHGYDTVIIVTAAYHMPRALVEARRISPALKLQPFPVYPDNVKLEQWWAFGGTARVLASEYNKYLISLARVSLLDAIGDET